MSGEVYEVTMPKLGETVTGGVVSQWLKHLGIAVDLDQQGLVAPVVKNADALNLRGLARATALPRTGRSPWRTWRPTWRPCSKPARSRDRTRMSACHAAASSRRTRRAWPARDTRSVPENNDLTGTDSRRSADERPTRTENSPGGQTQARASSSKRAKARPGTASLTSALWPGPAVAAAKAASARTGRPASGRSGST
jgi:2-oxoacid dehydrogenases acyltransferase (catalytic domain)